MQRLAALAAGAARRHRTRADAWSAAAAAAAAHPTQAAPAAAAGGPRAAFSSAPTGAPPPAVTDPSRIRNWCICAHVDHGKTTLFDRLLAACDVSLTGERAMDSGALEKERGITILSKVGGGAGHGGEGGMEGRWGGAAAASLKTCLCTRLRGSAASPSYQRWGLDEGWTRRARGAGPAAAHGRAGLGRPHSSQPPTPYGNQTHAHCQVTSFAYRGHLINALDTPGHADFGGERRAHAPWRGGRGAPQQHAPRPAPARRAALLAA